MTTPPSRHWQQLRRRALWRAAYRCEKCGAPPKRRSLDVHHLTYARIGRELLADVRVMCHSCHSQWHAQRNSIRPSLLPLILYLIYEHAGLNRFQLAREVKMQAYQLKTWESGKIRRPSPHYQGILRRMVQRYIPEHEYLLGEILVDVPDDPESVSAAA